MDEASIRVFDRMEVLRGMEVKRCLRRVSRDRIRAIRRERIRWAVSSVGGKRTQDGTEEGRT